MSKEKELHIRMSDEDAEFLKLLCEKYQCSKTELITELIRKGEYTVLNYDTIKQFNVVFGRIGNNINQIARSLNIINKTQLMNDEQFQFISDMYKSIQHEYLKYQLESDKMIRKIFRIRLNKERIDYINFTQNKLEGDKYE